MFKENLFKRYKQNEPIEWYRQTQFYLILNPYCKICLKKHKIVPAEKVSPIVKPANNYNLFWDKANWQGLCLYHYNRKKLSENNFYKNTETL